MRPDIDWKINDESGEHTIVKTTSNRRSHQRRIVLVIVILLGTSLGVIYSSIPEPALMPAHTNVALQPTATYRPPRQPSPASAISTATPSPTSVDRTSTPTSTLVSVGLTDMELAAMPTLEPPVSPVPTLVPMQFAAVVKPTRSTLGLTTPTPLPTILPLPTLQLVSTDAKPLPCEVHPKAGWRSRYAPYHDWFDMILLPDQGILWVGATSGIFQVDTQRGVVTRSLTLDSAAGVDQIYPLGEGRLWVSAESKNFYYDGREWATIPITGANPPLRVHTIDSNGDLWVCNFLAEPTKACRDMYLLAGHTPPPNHEWWIATPSSSRPDSNSCGSSESPYYHPHPGGCQSLENARQLARTKIPDDPSMPRLTTDFVEFDADGSIWWADVYLDGDDNPVWSLFHIVGDKITKIKLPAYWVNTTMPDPQHGIWLGTDRGWLYSDGVDVRAGLTELDVCSEPFFAKEVEVDTSGKTWALTDIGTLYSLAPGVLKWQQIADPYRVVTPIDTYGILSIAAASDGGIWATHGDDLFHLSSSSVSLPIQLPGYCTHIENLRAAGNSIWATGAECGLLQFDVNQMTWTSYLPNE
ncbi:MAG TPA: hypothetical protein VMP08_20120 [Anaerolineae bacterium]|nr:hypothetical protein [Anaerolineae bacterium]